MTPMELQYLVGLCCLRRSPDDVEIILGDMVLDEASQKLRDVDVTVRMKGDDGTVTAFMGVEVKQESKPLDVATVEQLNAKLVDMPDVTHRALVSASGFTDGARRKAVHHDLELYSFEPWTGRVRDTLPLWESAHPPEAVFSFHRALLYWADARLNLVVPNAPSSFTLTPGSPLYRDVEVHEEYPTFGDFKNALLLRSTGLLWSLEPARTLRQLPPAEIDREQNAARSMFWAHTHTVDVRGDGIHIDLSGGRHQLTHVTISGRLYWEWKYEAPEYTVLKKVSDGSVFAGAMVAPGRTEGELLCFVHDPSSPTAGVHFVRLTEKQQKLLHKLNLTAP